MDTDEKAESMFLSKRPYIKGCIWTMGRSVSIVGWVRLCREALTFLKTLIMCCG